MNTLVASQKFASEILSDDIPEVMSALPISTLSCLKKIEEWLSDASNKKAMIHELGRIGGTSIKEITRKIMYRTLSNEIGQLYSWEGAKKKKSFKELNIASVILASVRLCMRDAKESEIILFIKLWLVRCKDRLENSRKRKMPVDDIENEME